MSDKRQQPERERFEAEAEARFLAAARRARRTAAFREEERKLGANKGRQTAAIAATFLLAVGLVTVLVLLNQPVHELPDLFPAAEQQHLIKGVVYSSADEQTLAGVKIYAQAEPEQPAQARGFTFSTPAHAASWPPRPQLLAVSNAVGEFWVPDEFRDQAKLHLTLYDQAAQLTTRGVDAPPAEELDSFELYLEAPSEQRYPITALQPGTSQRLSDSLNVALDSTATQPWSGELLLDAKWPNNFQYGQVIAGIFSLSGDADNLPRIHYKLDEAQLKQYLMQPDETRLAVENPEYLELDDKEGYAHRGWYDTSAMPDGFDFLKHYELDYYEDEDGHWVTWQPDAGVRFALKSPVVGDGRVVAGYLVEVSGIGTELLYSGVKLLDRRNNQPWQGDVAVFEPDGKLLDFIPVYYWTANRTFLGISNRILVRSFTRNGNSYDLPELGSNEPHPYGYAMRRLDFTCTEAYEWPILNLPTGEPRGTYSIEAQPGFAGEVIPLRLIGDTKLIDEATSGPPLWDVLADGTTDARGLTCDLLVTEPGWHYVSVTFKEAEGDYVTVLQKVLVQARSATSRITGFDNATNSPILAGLLEPPDEQASLWLLSNKCTGDPPADRRSLKLSTLGPKLYLEPPAEFAGVPLRELRVILFVSPREGNKNWISPDFTPTTGSSVSFVEDVQLHPRIDKPDGMDQAVFDYISSDRTFICGDSVSWYVTLALGTDASSDQDAEAVVAALVHFTDTVSVFTERFWLEFGINLTGENLPPAEEIVAMLREYQESKYYQVKRPQGEKEEMVWHVNMRNAALEPGVGLVVGNVIEHMNMQVASIYELYSGGDTPARVELETADGRVYVNYFDYTALDGSG
ncbi:hypothetical protein JW859_09905 [bacterium]|nr:hypothetical protein [bacterium]